MSPAQPPEGILLHPPVGEPITCTALNIGPEVIDGEVTEVWEVMPARHPEGFGLEAGWHITVAVLPAQTTLRMCMPATPEYANPSLIVNPTMTIEGSDVPVDPPPREEP